MMFFAGSHIKCFVRSYLVEWLDGFQPFFWRWVNMVVNLKIGLEKFISLRLHYAFWKAFEIQYANYSLFFLPNLGAKCIERKGYFITRQP